MSPGDTVFITRYALTTGIMERKIARDPRDPDDVAADAVIVEWPSGLNGTAMFFRGQWQATREAAVAQANKMRVAKIASLKKQIAKLEAKSFS